MSGYLYPYAFPAMSAQGTEAFGKLIDPVTGLITTPNSQITDTPANVAKAISAVYAGEGQNVFPLLRITK
jgi:hypothetical protein